MAKGACSTIVSKMLRVILFKTRELRGKQRPERPLGWALRHHANPHSMEGQRPRLPETEE